MDKMVLGMLKRSLGLGCEHRKPKTKESGNTTKRSDSGFILFAIKANFSSLIVYYILKKYHVPFIFLIYLIALWQQEFIWFVKVYPSKYVY